jgi:MFS family permease
MPVLGGLPLSTRDSAYRWFTAGVASWFAAWGMQMVLFSWLVVGELGADPAWVGVAQTSTMLPSLGLLLYGGVLADRFEPRRMLVGLHVAAAVPALLLAAAVGTSSLSMPLLVAYGLTMGMIAAFVMPARDSMLSLVAGPDMMRAVTGMTAAQFGAQAIGNLLAGSARWFGSVPMLLSQATLLLAGSWVTAQVRVDATSRPVVQRPSVLSDILAGLRHVYATAQLRSPIILVVAVGFLFVGPFLVIFPLLVRDYYRGGVGDLSLVLMTFPIGTITGSLVLRARGGIVRRGRASLLALLCGATALAAIGTGPPFPVMVAVTTCWGLAGSVFINCSRTLYQEAAPPAQRASILSVYQLGFMGAAPLGSLSAGLASSIIGPLATLQLFAAGMLSLVVIVGLFTDTARLR